MKLHLFFSAIHAFPLTLHTSTSYVLLPLSEKHLQAPNPQLRLVCVFKQTLNANIHNSFFFIKGVLHFKRDSLVSHCTVAKAKPATNAPFMRRVPCHQPKTQIAQQTQSLLTSREHCRCSLKALPWSCTYGK